MTSVHHVGLTEFGQQFAGQFTPSSMRLGVAVIADAPPAVTDPIDAAVLEADLTPARRVARLLPRFAETNVRPPDVADFIIRYGHEYVSVVLPDTISTGADRHEIEQACEASGCVLWWYNETA